MAAFPSSLIFSFLYFYLYLLHLGGNGRIPFFLSLPFPVFATVQDQVKLPALDGSPGTAQCCTFTIIKGPSANIQQLGWRPGEEATKYNKYTFVEEEFKFLKTPF